MDSIDCDFFKGLVLSNNPIDSTIILVKPGYFPHLDLS